MHVRHVHHSSRARVTALSVVDQKHKRNSGQRAALYISETSKFRYW